MATATFGAGCFWGVEEAFRTLDGVIATAAGFMGGTPASPSYEEVCTGATGHAEVVQIEFDPAIVTYDALLDVFWRSHDPTQKDRQGSDVGSQYRSAIFTHDDAQAAAAAASRAAQAGAGRWSAPIATVIEPAGDFHRAEEYHQQYLMKRGRTSCSLPPED